MSKRKVIPQKQPAVSRPTPASVPTGKVTFVFARDNYILLLAGLALILLGFILMIGGGSDNPNEFSDEIFNFRRMTLAPLLVLAGYVVEVYAIMRKPRSPKAEASDAA